MSFHSKRRGKPLESFKEGLIKFTLGDTSSCHVENRLQGEPESSRKTNEEAGMGVPARDDGTWTSEVAMALRGVS